MFKNGRLIYCIVFVENMGACSHYWKNKKGSLVIVIYLNIQNFFPSQLLVYISQFWFISLFPHGNLN